MSYKTYGQRANKTSEIAIIPSCNHCCQHL